MLGKKLAIDLGTATARMLVRGETGCVEEPALISLTAPGPPLIGSAAMRAAASASIGLIRPLRRAAIVDETALQALIANLVTRAVGRQRIFKPDAVAVVHSPISGRDRRMVLDMLAATGTRTAYLLDAPLAAAMGAGLTLAGPEGHLIVDIGSQNIEVATLAEEGRIVARYAERGGEDLATEVRQAVEQRHGCEVAAEVGEELIRAVASALPSRQRSAEVRVDGDAMLEVNVADLADVVAAHVAIVVNLIREVLAETPPQLLDDILGDGVLLTGGGAALDGLAEQIGSQIGLPVRAAAEPHLCCVRGAAVAADSLDVLKRNFMYIR